MPSSTGSGRYLASNVAQEPNYITPGRIAADTQDNVVCYLVNCKDFNSCRAGWVSLSLVGYLIAINSMVWCPWRLSQRGAM